MCFGGRTGRVNTELVARIGVVKVSCQMVEVFNVVLTCDVYNFYFYMIRFSILSCTAPDCTNAKKIVPITIF